MAHNIQKANRLIVAGYLIPLFWFFLYQWIGSKSQNEAENLGSGIIVVGTFALILFCSFFSLAMGSVLSGGSLFATQRKSFCD